MRFSTLLLCFGLLPLLTHAETFHPDCADPHNKEISCSVHVVDCDSIQVPLASDDSTVPPEAHDVRVDAFARATARDKSTHQLHVDISWQLPPNNESFRMRAFELEIDGSGIRKCFIFNVSDFGWTEDSASPRFHFSSDSLFEFSESYDIWLRSLPRSNSKRPQIHKFEKMPKSPDHNVDDRNNITAWCKSHSDPQASKWTAAFRRIFLHSLARTIQIEFVGAPAHYCFESYEVRLMDESGLELLHSHVVDAKDMKTEIIQGKAITFGEFNFTGLQMETDYIPSVIPLERASDGRCLCPIGGENGNPFDSHVVCSCIAADWKRVRLHRIERPKGPICVDCIEKNSTIVEIPKENENNRTLVAFLTVLLLALCVVGLIYVLLMIYRKYKRSRKGMNIRFISDRSQQGAALVATEPRAPLIFNTTCSVLIVYAHDCQLHESSVIAFAELLRDTFRMQVHLDKWDVLEIEQNVSEYINGSIVRADQIIIVNSIGAFLRVQARHKKMELIERINPGHLDNIFASQIDLALQHARVMSVRFSYTPSTYTLFALSPLLQYTVPDNIGLLVSSINECPIKADPRLAGFDPALAKLHASVSRMAHYIDSDPNWFERSHHGIRQLPIAASVSAMPCPLHLNQSIDSGISDTVRTGAIVITSSPVESEGAPLLESPVSEVQKRLQELVPEEPSTSKFEPIPSTSDDSAYLSEVMHSVQSNKQDDSCSEASGSDRPDDPIIHNTLDEKTLVVKPTTVVEALKNVKDPDYASNDDSGLISDLHSGLIT